MQPLFDAYFIVDWSASNTPKRGKDSIWIAEMRREKEKLVVAEPINVATRAETMAYLEERFIDLLARGRRIFAGFDFPFGYPAGAASLIAGEPHWEALWRFFHDEVEDDAKNRSNRFTLASAINARCFPGAAVYWGRPHQHSYDCLSARKPKHAAKDAMEFRIVETWQRPAKSVWQLAYNGAVGSQAMLGLAHLEALRQHPALKARAAVWPFETAFADTLEAPLVIAEIYPSMFTIAPRAGEVKDRAQVRAAATQFSALDAEGKFRDMLAAPPGLTATDKKSVLTEEGWIVGAGRIGKGD